MRTALILMLTANLVGWGCEVGDGLELAGEEVPHEVDAGLSEIEAGDGDDGGGGGEQGEANDAPADTCVGEGDQGNELGVGAWCTPGGDECQDLLGAPFCTVDLNADVPVWTCTRSCLDDEECGTDARCWRPDGDATRCLPISCLD